MNDIKIKIIWMDGCSKCSHVKKLLDCVNNEIKIDSINSKCLSKKMLKKYDLKVAPTLLVFSANKFLGKIERGFTKKNLEREIKRMGKLNVNTNIFK